MRITVMQKERKVLLNAIASSKNELRSALNEMHNVIPKSAEASEAARKKGNALLLQQNKHDAQTHKEIFSHYCKSIALAPNESQELAVAYGNRSYLLLHMHKYEDCIKDIDRALKITNSDLLKAKLLCRKADRLTKLGSSNVSNILEMVQDHAEKIDDQNKKKILVIIDAVKALAVDTKKVDMSSKPYFSEHNEKYGRHLIAAQDYKPGDIIFVERVYTSAFASKSELLACDYCLKLVWSTIPCSYCDWSMYCSESCKEEAWNKYHDIECSIISYLKEHYDMDFVIFHLAVRILITGIKETGNFTNLKKALELLGQRTDGLFKGFSKNPQFGFNNIQNVYSFDSSIPYESLVEISKIVPLILISFIKYSKLKDHFNVKEIEELMLNEDVVFLGSLLIKTFAVLVRTGCGFDYDEFKYTRKQSEIVHNDTKRCYSMLFNLLNHSCFPNADWRCTAEKKLLVFALQPIKKNSQIFISYSLNFELDVLSTRKSEICQRYDFECDCRACVEKWPAIKLPGVVDPKAMEVDAMNDMTRGKFSLFALQEMAKALEEGRDVKSYIEKLS